MKPNDPHGHKMKNIYLIALLSFLWSSSAVAAEQCYSPYEAQAEQLLRLHSELMVITVTCRQGSNGENLVPLYTHFTRTNLPVLHDAEQTMIGYYKAHSTTDAIGQLDRLRTRLGNEFGQHIADLSAPEFCQRYRDKVALMADETRDQIYQESARMAENDRSEVPLCAPPASRLAKSN